MLAGGSTTSSRPSETARQSARCRDIIAGAQAYFDRKELASTAFERTRMPMLMTDAQQPDLPIVLAAAGRAASGQHSELGLLQISRRLLPFIKHVWADGGYNHESVAGAAYTPVRTAC